MQPGRFCPGLSVDNVKQALCATFAEEYGDYQILELSEEALKEIQGLLINIPPGNGDWDGHPGLTCFWRSGFPGVRYNFT